MHPLLSLLSSLFPLRSLPAPRCVARKLRKPRFCGALPATFRMGGTLVACGALWCANPVWAQTIYRSVDAQGRVVFSDKPPTDSQSAQPLDIPSAKSSNAVATAGMPFALRQAVAQYPVTLYTTKDCGPCDGGRAWLQRRGVPFAEKTVQSPEDAKALRQLFGSVSIPMLTVGAQHIRGFSEAEWEQNIDAAGYPPESQLPPGYSNPAPTALVPPKTPLSPPSSEEPAQSTSLPAVAPPSGFQF